MKKYLNVLLIPGHGGINPHTGKYVTPGKRSPVWPDGTQLFEGVFNRKVVDHILKLCEEGGINATNLVPEWEDISLAERVKRVNEASKGVPNSLMIEVHGNGFTKESANGFEFFTSTGLTPSDHIADVMIEEYQKTIPSIRLRKGIGGLLSKDRDFYVIRHTELKCPSILIECAFMTNYRECKMMLEKPELFAQAIYNGLETVKSKYG